MWILVTKENNKAKWLDTVGQRGDMAGYFVNKRANSRYLLVSALNSICAYFISHFPKKIHKQASHGPLALALYKMLNIYFRPAAWQILLHLCRLLHQLFPVFVLMLG